MIESKYLKERRNKMTNTFTDPWAEYRAKEKARLEALTPEQKIANANSHHIGVVDDCYRCVNCEIGKWNAWKQHC
jgi:hypothetical protein